VLHQAAGEYGLETESVGEGRERRVVLKPPAEDKKAAKTKKSEE
jgi:hypothetical protein